jgi:hypothetical protein
MFNSVVFGHKDYIKKKGVPMNKIECVTLSGSRFEVSDDFKFRGMHDLWVAYEHELNDYGDTPRAKMLIEAHRIMSAVLDGSVTITKGGVICKTKKL